MKQLRYTVRTWIKTGLDGWTSEFDDFADRDEAKRFAEGFINQPCQGEVIERDAWIFDNKLAVLLPGWGDEPSWQEVLR